VNKVEIRNAARADGTVADRREPFASPSPEGGGGRVKLTFPPPLAGGGRGG